MSCSMTIDAVRDRTKTVTRRHVDTWKNLKPGDRLTLIEKGMGLKPGEKQVVLAEVEIVSVTVEPIGNIVHEDCGTGREGLGHMRPLEFVEFWLKGHGYKVLGGGLFTAGEVAVLSRDLCRRIEWRYL